MIFFLLSQIKHRKLRNNKLNHHTKATSHYNKKKFSNFSSSTIILVHNHHHHHQRSTIPFTTPTSQIANADILWPKIKFREKFLMCGHLIAPQSTVWIHSIHPYTHFFQTENEKRRPNTHTQTHYQYHQTIQIYLSHRYN